MGKYFLFCLIGLCALSAAAQDTTGSLPRKTIVAAEIGMPGIGLAAEWNHGRPFTIETSAYLGPSYVVDDAFLAFILQPTYARPAARFSISPRVYLNMQNRLKPRKKKFTQVDWYLGAGYSYITASFDKFNNPAHLATLHLGARQFFSPRGIISAHVGLGYAASPRDVAHTFYPSLNIKLGYRLY